MKKSRRMKKRSGTPARPNRSGWATSKTTRFPCLAAAIGAVAYPGSVRRLGLLIGALVVLAGCGGGGSGSELGEGPAVSGFGFGEESAVDAGQAIDPAYTCDGNGFSPTLAWQGAPEGTRELALVLEDPDAPGATFTHRIRSA